MSAVVPDDFDYAAEISFLEIREQFPLIDPESLSPKDVWPSFSTFSSRSQASLTVVMTPIIRKQPG